MGKTPEVDPWHLLATIDEEWRTAARIKTHFGIRGNLVEIAKSLERMADAGTVERTYHITKGVRRPVGHPHTTVRHSFIIYYRKKPFP